MEDKLRLNTELYGFDGIIGRRDYFLNGIIIASIALAFILPYQIWLFSNIGTMTDLFNLHLMFFKSPILLKIWFLLGTSATFVLSASNVFRRLNDINGSVNIPANISVTTLLFLFNICLILPFKFSFFIGLIDIILALIILFKKGKITSNYPYDFTKEFNWGAYLGTWIWGLFNKSYKTLWMLLVGFTPWGAYYQLYCGLKGNEWAYKNKKWNDVNLFNKSQEKQSAIFTVLLFVGIPVIYFLIILGFVTFFMFTTINDMENNPQKAEQTMTNFEDTMSKYGSFYFKSHLITPNENKYYVSSSDWSTYTFKEKTDVLDLAACLASSERKKEYRKRYPNSYKSFSKASELQRTKIYSSETKQLLGEYYIDESSLESGSLKDILKAGMNAYKFYKDKE